MERFEAVSKLLFTKIVDEREFRGSWNGHRKNTAEFVWQAGEGERAVYERVRAVWHRAVTAYPQIFAGSRADFPADVAGVARIVRLLEGVEFDATPVDVKGGAYEEILRNTFEKNENQQYFTPRHLVDFIVEMVCPPEWASVCDPAAGSGGFLIGALDHVAKTGGDSRAFAARLRGAEIDDRMAWIARINVLMHDGDPAGIHHLPGAGSLAPPSSLETALPNASCDLILTNPPFGSDLTDTEALRHFEVGRGRPSRRRGVLFLERCIQLLRPGGRLAIVLDDSVLNLPSNKDIRCHVLATCLVEAVISLPDVAFMPYSTAKSSVLIIKKRMHDNEKQGTVFMADVEHVGNRPNGDPLFSEEYDESGNRTLLSDLPLVLDAYREYAASGAAESSRNGTMMFSADIGESATEEARLDVYYFHPARRVAETLLQRSVHPVVRLSDVATVEGAVTAPADEYGEEVVRWIGLADIEAGTGQFEVRLTPGDRIRSSAHMFKRGDILFSRLRPKLRKTILINQSDEEGVCSSELLVLRVKPEVPVLPEYVAHLLRSDLVFGQLIYQITGVGRPRVSTSSVRKIRFPLPPIGEQTLVVDELNRAGQDAQRQKTMAFQQLERSRLEIEAAYDRTLGRMFRSDSPRPV